MTNDNLPASIDTSLWPTAKESDTSPNQTEVVSRSIIHPKPFPNTGAIWCWEAVSWRVFGSYEAPPHIIKHRSFDHGNDRRPPDTPAIHKARQEEHKSFDAAERELFDLIARKQVKIKGQLPAKAASGRRLNVRSFKYLNISNEIFLNEQLNLAFSPGGELIYRLDMLERLFPSHELRKSEVDPYFPLYFNVMVNTTELNIAWPASSKTAHTIAGEKLLQAWLETEMCASFAISPGKKEMQIRATAAGHSFSNEGFLRAWAQAVKATGAVAWSKAGPKSKGSNRGGK